MKNIYLVLTIVLVLLMLTLPLIALSPKAEPQKGILQNDVGVTQVVKNGTVTLSYQDGKSVTMGVNEYIFGVVAAEMPMSYGDEAIKAQAVAARTYLLYRSHENVDKGYNITVSPDTDQAFITRSEAKTKWGDKASDYTKRLDEIIKQTENIYIYFENKPILAAYHAISGGKTETCKNVWGKDIAYLKSVDSIGDLLAPKYQSNKNLSVDDFKKVIGSKCNLPDKAEKYIGKITHTDSGYVKSIAIGDKTFTGSEIRTLFDLRSSNFDVAFSDGKFNFTVRGYGHGVGMSQYGAHYMAQQGNTYDEILLWYYSGCDIVKVNPQ